MGAIALTPVTKRCFLLLLIAIFGGLAMGSARAQEAIGDLDLLYPQFAHPEKDAAVAIRRRDFRFITTNRQRTIVPGVDRHANLRRKYGTKYIRQPFRIFATSSQNFSFNLRARTYAGQYNEALLKYLLAHQQKRKRK